MSPRPIRIGSVAPTAGGQAIYKNEDFIQLALRRRGNGSHIWLKCLKATAALYGWDKAFPTVIEARAAASPDGAFRCPSRRGWTSGGGKVYRISQSPKTQGYPPGMTHTFRLSSNATGVDLANVAKAIQIDWHWICMPSGGRWTKQRFEQPTST